MIREDSVLHSNSLKTMLSSIQRELPFEAIDNSPAYLSRDNLNAYLKLKSQKTNFSHVDFLQAGIPPLHDIHPHIRYSIQKMLNHFTLTDENPSCLLNPIYATQIRRQRSLELFGSANPSIMVTLNSTMIDHPEMISQLLINGMKIARINCAHDSPDTWRNLVKIIKNAEKKLGVTCKIHMELAGPKIRVNKILYSCEDIKKGERPNFKIFPGDAVYIIKHITSADLFSQKDKVFSVSLARALTNVREEDRIYINDGKVIGKVCRVTDDFIKIIIMKTVKDKSKIREQDGINLPDSFVHFIMPAVTDEDLAVLPDVHELSDSIGLSYVHHPRDLEKLYLHLKRLSPKKLGIIAKIETKEAVQNLTKIVREGLNFDKFGIMIARGDLAVELGFTELAAVQEEILSLCQASHIPVIWATGVLESLTKKGIPLRSELTDAYMGIRADCIMLNKGDYILDSIKMIQDLINMNRHEQRI